MRGVLVFAALVALAIPAAAADAIGILRLSPSVAHPAGVVTVVAGGYLGPKPWRPMPVVMIPVARAPRGFDPILRRSGLRPPRYRVVGAIRRWRAVGESGVNATGRLRFRVPRIAAARYVFALFCDPCFPGLGGASSSADSC